MHVGTVAAGRIGTAVLRRLKPFDVHPHYTDKHRLPREVEEELGLTFHPDAAAMVPHCDVVTVNAPLHPQTEGLFGDELIGSMKRGAYLINTARAKIADRDAIVRALESGQLAGYAGDVWYPQPAPADHPWRTMPHHRPLLHDPDALTRPGSPGKRPLVRDEGPLLLPGIRAPGPCGAAATPCRRSRAAGPPVSWRAAPRSCPGPSPGPPS